MGWGFHNMGSYVSNPDPWSAMAQKFWGSLWLIILFAILNSVLAGAISPLNAATRVIYSMGQIHVLPSVFGRTHPKHHTPHIAMIAATLFAIGFALGWGLAVGPTNAFILIGGADGVLIILMYMLMCIANIAYYLTKARARFNVLLHLVLPAIGFLFLIPPLYFVYSPLPAAPTVFGNWIAAVWAVAGVAAMILFGIFRPPIIYQARELFVENEAPGKGTGEALPSQP
jgi:amino acid transporter